MLIAQHVFAILLAAAVSGLLVFTATYTLTSLYIAHKRKPVSKHGFMAPAEPYIIKRDKELNRAPDSGGVDGAKSIW